MSLEKMIKVIPHRIDNAAMSLSIDRTLFDIMNRRLQKNHAVVPVFRTYQFSNPTVVFGNHQSLKDRYDSSAIKGVDLVRRDTGGGHLYFERQDLHFSFLAPSDFYESNDLLLQYHKVNSFIVNALKKCGYKAYLGRTSVRVDGKILVGSARKHEKHASLHQGVIMHTKYDDNIFKLLMAKDEEVRRWNELITSLQDYDFDSSIIAKELVSSIGPHYEENLGDEEIKMANNLYYTKYNNPEFINQGTKYEDICLIALEWTKDNDKK